VRVQGKRQAGIMARNIGAQSQTEFRYGEHQLMDDQEYLKLDKKKLTRRGFLRRLAAAGAGLACRGGISARIDDNRPNFIIIFADDQGYGDLGCFGSSNIKTPNIDRMAAQGMKFTDFYVAAPLCTPSRAALLTGRYPRRVGLARGVLRPDSRRGIDPKETTIAELLKTRGYATCCVGKWHLGFVGPYRPTHQGFDYYYGLHHNLDEPEAEHFDDVGGVPIMRNDEVALRPASPEVLTELYTREAIGFIRRNRNRPFFLYLAHTMPHVPLGVSKKFAGKSAGGLYGDVIECLDWSTGQILDTLVRLGLDSNTIVVYTSDNGPSPRATGSALPLRGRKHTTFEGGMRVPCVMWGPGKVAAGKVCSEVATSMDFYPTFARLAGAEVPLYQVIDGKDIYSLIMAQSGAKSPHDAFFFHDGRGRLKAVRAGKWKLHLGEKPVLNDLSTDIGEQKNVASERPDVVGRLSKLAADFDKHFVTNL
jgi:arylsulfatase A-like enzyme